MGPVEQALREQVVAVRRRLALAVAPPVIAEKPSVRTVRVNPPPKPVPPGPTPLEVRLRKILRRPSVNKAVMEISKAHGVSPMLVAGQNRERAIVAARNQVFDRLYRDGVSLSEIGRIFGKDHTTVLHGIRRFRGEPTKANRQAEIAAGTRFPPLSTLPTARLRFLYVDDAETREFVGLSGRG